LASMTGQAYSSLLRSRKALSVVPGHGALLVGAAVGFAVFVSLALPWARRFVGAELSGRHAAIVGAILAVFFTFGWWFAKGTDLAARSRLENLLIGLPGAAGWGIAIAPLAWHRALAAFRPRLAWLDEGRAPREEEGAALA